MASKTGIATPPPPFYRSRGLVTPSSPSRSLPDPLAGRATAIPGIARPASAIDRKLSGPQQVPTRTTVYGKSASAQGKRGPTTRTAYLECSVRLEFLRGRSFLPLDQYFRQIRSSFSAPLIAEMALSRCPPKS